MNKEIFKDVPNYQGLYQVSNLGNVKSFSREIDSKRGKYTSKERILKPRNTGKYYRVCLFKEGKRKFMSVHVLVAIAFLGHVSNGNKIEVDHKNGVKTDNRAENLQLLTNRQHKTKTSKNKKTSSRYTGVSWHKKANKWMAYITIDGKIKHLGYFKDEYEAHLSYQKKLSELNEKLC
jgi:hypothetical protein